MDLRVKKTKRAIRSAFYALIQEKPLEKITVRELAEKAEINKTTFYAHYETIYDLVRQLEQETVDEVVQNLTTAQDLLDSPRSFIRDLYAILNEQSQDWGMFPATSMASFAQELRTAILKKAQQEGIETSRYEDIGAVLVFIVNGLLGIQRFMPERAEPQLDTIAAFVEAGVRELQRRKTC